MKSQATKQFEALCSEYGITARQLRDLGLSAQVKGDRELGEMVLAALSNDVCALADCAHTILTIESMR